MDEEVKEVFHFEVPERLVATLQELRCTLYSEQ